MKKLIIAEKPSLAMEIVKAAGKMNKNDGYFENDEYIISFAFGHLLALQDIDDYYKREKTRWSLKELPFVPGEFIFKLRDDSGVKKQYKIHICNMNISYYYFCINFNYYHINMIGCFNIALYSYFDIHRIFDLISCRL